MGRMSKRFQEIVKRVDPDRSYTLEEAIDILKGCPPVKFDQSVEVALKLGIDPRKSDQAVRGTVPLPNGTGKALRVLVFAKDDKAAEALAAGADYAGSAELLAKVESGWTDFDVVVSTPDEMRNVGKLGKILGPRGLMPTPKAGTVTTDVATIVRELRAGKVEFKGDRTGMINLLVGKLSFGTAQLVENIRALLHAIWRSKPASAKGQYFQRLCLSSTMGPGLKIDPREFPV
jgi:large subunit ribosomal protein L1